MAALQTWLCTQPTPSSAPSDSTLLNCSGVRAPLLPSAVCQQQVDMPTLLQTLPWAGVLAPAAGLTVLLLLLWRLACAPLNRVKTVSDVGWGFLQEDGARVWWLSWLRRRPLKGRNLAKQIQRLQRLRTKGTLPPVYPNGWFAVAESRSLRVGQVLSVQALGQQLAVFRGSSGKALAVDAYCPHLGANMAAGGSVRGDCLECPFHGWQFNGNDGSCTSIPYTSHKVPDPARVRRWETHEVNGFVFVWHDAEGAAPRWHLPEWRQVTDGLWRYRGRTRHEVLAHVQEIPENGADIAHLGHLHVPSVFKGANLTEVFASSKILDIAQHEWRGMWQPLEGSSSHLATVSIEHVFSVRGGAHKLFKMSVEATQIGPGLVHLHLNTFLGEGVLIQTVTPIGPLRQQITHHLYTSAAFIAPFAKFVLYSEACHLERDIMIWNSKQYLQRPVLVAEDKLIKKFRTWYRQFYSDNSPTMGSLERNDIDW